MAFVTFFPSGGGGGGGNTDRFAPKYLVGNTAYSLPDTASIAGLAAGFQYFPDPGDGSGIRAACAAAAVDPGDIWVRPGNYQIPSGQGPITIPGVTLRGSGSSTVVRGAPDGDQGVFILATSLINPLPGFARLEQILVQVAAPTGPTAGSVAAVLCQDTVGLSDVNVLVEVRAAGTIRNGVRFTTVNSAFPASDVLDLTVAVDTDTTTDIGIELVPGQNGGATVFVRNVQVFGFQGMSTGVRVDRSILVASQLAVLNFSVAGVEFVTTPDDKNGRISIDEGYLQTGTGTPTTVGALLDGSSHVLHSVAIQGFGAAGIRLLATPDANPAAGISRDVEIDDVQIDGFSIGIEVGSLGGLFGAGATGNTISNSQINATSRGIYFTGPVVDRNHIIDNNVNVQGGFSPPVLGGITIDEDPQQPGAINNFVRGNAVNVTCPFSQSFTHCIELHSQLGVCSDNVCNLVNGGYCIELGDGAERVVTQGNVCQAGGDADSLGCIHVAPGTPNVRLVINGNSCTVNYAVDPAPGTITAIVCEGLRCVVSNNAIFVGTPGGATPGIVLSAATTQVNCIGNVCEGSGGVAVTDLGALNNVAQNVGA